MVATDLGACEWFVWDLRRSNLIDRGRLDQIVGEFLQKNPRADPPVLAQFLVETGVLTEFQAERLLQGKTQGFVLGPFTLADALGSGSMGTVYKAQSKTDNNWFAVKVLPRRSMWNVRLARRKVRSFEQVKHPAVVPFVDVGTAGGMHYLAWPLVQGESLSRVVERAGKLTPELAAHFAFQIAEGLDSAHRAQIIHGLIKPSNIMVGPDNTAYILDFGIGCLLAETEGESLVDTMSTANSVASGLDCASPESIMDPTNLTSQGDQYSLGCVLYYMLTGQYPFPDGNMAEKMMAHQFQQPTTITDLNPSVPSEIVEIVERLMQKKPEDRYSSIGDAAGSLRHFANVSEQNEPKPAAKRTPAPPAARNAPAARPSNKGTSVEETAERPATQKPGWVSPTQPTPARPRTLGALPTRESLAASASAEKPAAAKRPTTLGQLQRPTPGAPAPAPKPAPSRMPAAEDVGDAEVVDEAPSQERVIPGLYGGEQAEGGSSKLTYVFIGVMAVIAATFFGLMYLKLI